VSEPSGAAGREAAESRLSGKVVLITGAGRGSGRLLAESLARGGAVVAANDVTPVNVEPLVEEIRRAGGRAHVYVEDIAKKVAAQALVNRVEEELGRIDVLIHHAAVEPHVPLLKMDEWDWHRTLDVNVTAAFLMMQSTARVMRAHGGGVILNVIGAPEQAQADHAAYDACAGALVSLTRAAARELGPQGIRVHALLHGHMPDASIDEGAPPSLGAAALRLCEAADLNGLVWEVEV